MLDRVKRKTYNNSYYLFSLTLDMSDEKVEKKREVKRDQYGNVVEDKEEVKSERD